MTAASVALRATGLLRAFNDAGVLHAADVHVATRLGALAGERDERVLLAVALCVRGVRQGAVALPLAEVPALVTADDAEGEPAAALPEWPEPGAWLDAVAASPLVAPPGDDPGSGPARPVRLEDGALWLDRYWRQEVVVAEELLRRAADPPEVDDAVLAAALARLWPGTAPDDQRRAAAVCALSRVSVLGGGPGTGKTTTVAGLLAVLRQVAGQRPLRVALAAPTGKAAARLTEAVQSAARRGDRFDDDDRALLSALQASTLHRLLGALGGTGRFRHGAEAPLPHDVVVVDEASMVSLPLFARLLEALRPTARLVLVGDPDQLASVEAGAVLDDLTAGARTGERTPALAARLRGVLPHDADDLPVGADAPAARVRDGIAVLTGERRFAAHGPIARLARAVRAGDGPGALAVLQEGADAVAFDPVPDDAPVPGPVLERLRSDSLAVGARLVAAARAGDAPAALAVLGEHRLLCAHRRGPRGVAEWTRTVERWWRDELGVVPRRDGRYPGLPLLVTANDRDTGLHNGDTGVVVAAGDELVAAFDRGDGVVTLPLGRLADVRPLHAMTVHRSQGSQFGAVTVLLPPASSPLGTRQTLYTAVTRAQHRLRVVGSAEAVAAAVARPVARATGLRRRLA